MILGLMDSLILCMALLVIESLTGFLVHSVVNLGTRVEISS